jgi:hypothetical protein
VVIALSGCSPPAASGSPEAGVLHFDGAMLEGRDGGTSDAGGGDLPPATINPDGVLTPFPYLAFRVVPPEFRIVTANFTVTHDGDSRGPLLEMLLEVENAGTEIECGFVPDVYLDFTEVVTQVTADPFYDVYSSGTVSTVTNECIPPGGVGVMRGVQRGVDEADLAAALTLDVDARPLRIGIDHQSPSDEPLLEPTVAPVPGGFGVTGRMTPVRAIRNYGLRVYARDARGVLFTELLAFPGELAPLAAGLPQEFATTAATRGFTDYRAYQSWITE